VIFVGIATLENNASGVIDEEDREGAMQEPAAMHGCLSGRARRAIVVIDQNNLLFGHGDSIGIGTLPALT
jgi:hypothetical protein